MAVPLRISLSSYPSSRQRSDHDAVEEVRRVRRNVQDPPKGGPCFTQRRDRSAGANAKMGLRRPCLGTRKLTGGQDAPVGVFAGLDVCSERWHAPAEGPGARPGARMGLGARNPRGSRHRDVKGGTQRAAVLGRRGRAVDQPVPGPRGGRSIVNRRRHRPLGRGGRTAGRRLFDGGGRAGLGPGAAGAGRAGGGGRAPGAGSGARS